MRILFNETPMICNDHLCVAELLQSLKRLHPGTALALNQIILPRDQWEQHQLQDGDDLLLFEVIAGG